ncbi:hypothetical protein BBI10_13425 [Pseudomonas graminis]|uniref:HTH tetR-type domain-containing protein n=1 Tax=Pseudomonas graminis TaxID=158627 RepID=A0A1C2E0M0_9PSED|nr:hypothetical protein BBI10_13425 [Pseudomonas graminis]
MPFIADTGHFVDDRSVFFKVLRIMKKLNLEMRQHIIDVAKSLMTHKGYTSVGLAEVVSAAGVPKGNSQ